MSKYLRFALIGCGGLVLLFFVLFVGIVIGGSVDSGDSAIEENEAGQDDAEPAPREPIELSGSGSQATEPFELPAGLVRFEATHQGEGNFIVELLDEEGATVDLVANEVGSYDGSQAARVPEDGRHLLNVDADGAWTISVR